VEDLSKLLLLIIFLGGIIILQVFLSKRENKWLGLILPIISIMFSILTVLGLAFYGNQSTVEIIFQLIMVFLLSNIPTIILLAIYFACREKFKKNRELDKMNIQDLE
jgi:predicted RND superfamily exporter protein